MSVEQSAEARICPYWRKYINTGDYFLALCGKKFPQEPRLLGNESLPRLRKCPWFGAVDAYKSPSILECDRASLRKGLDFAPEPIVMADLGAKGINELESIWDQEVEKFIQRHSQS